MSASISPAKLVGRQVLRTNSYYRPNPSLFNYPGLNTRPFFDNHQDFPFVKDFQNNLDVIKQEYLNLQTAYGDRDDYVK